MGNFIVTVLDGFGVGYMPDAAEVRPADVGANTFRHILDSVDSLSLPTLRSLGLMNIAGFETPLMKYAPGATFGRAALTHFGADTFWGHQEIMGTSPRRPFEQPFKVHIDEAAAALKSAGYTVEYYCGSREKYLIVNNSLTVADNIECDPGQAVNITAAIDDIPFDEVVKVGKIVRSIVKVSRVIAFGGSGVHIADILSATEEKENGYIGVNAPASGVYNSNYHCVHLGYGVDPATQLPTILDRHGIPTYLLGKVADIVHNPSPDNSFSIVPTAEVTDRLCWIASSSKQAFICANIQETDLCGHRENPAEYYRILKIADEGLGRLVGLLRDDDILIVMADHGNDPTIGHPHHTREYVPLMITGRGLKPGSIGIRATLSDVAATAAEYFGCEMPENGSSFFKLLRD